MREKGSLCKEIETSSPVIMERRIEMIAEAGRQLSYSGGSGIDETCSYLISQQDSNDQEPSRPKRGDRYGEYITSHKWLTDQPLLR